jgi:hypothetical protein
LGWSWLLHLHSNQSPEFENGASFVTKEYLKMKNGASFFANGHSKMANGAWFKGLFLFVRYNAVTAPSML